MIVLARPYCLLGKNQSKYSPPCTEQFRTSQLPLRFKIFHFDKSLIFSFLLIIIIKVHFIEQHIEDFIERRALPGVGNYIHNYFYLLRNPSQGQYNAISLVTPIKPSLYSLSLLKLDVYSTRALTPNKTTI